MKKINSNLRDLFLVAILIVLDSKGGIFYRQIRVGKDGKEFGLLKFRTMHPEAEDIMENLIRNKTIRKCSFFRGGGYSGRGGWAPPVTPPLRSRFLYRIFHMNFPQKCPVAFQWPVNPASLPEPAEPCTTPGNFENNVC